MDDDAVISDCGTWRYRLDRHIDLFGSIVIGYYGVNGSTAGKTENDQTVRKWNGFTFRFGGSKYIVGNPFAYRARDVRELVTAVDPIGPENDYYLRQIIDEVDLHVPCWGNETKVPQHLRYRFGWLKDQLFASGKPVRVFGLSKDGYPMHPLILPYTTKLRGWHG